MKLAINPDGTFQQRPALGTRFLSPIGTAVEVAATWEAGVVFVGEWDGNGGCCNAPDFVSQYKPMCPVCQEFHEPEYPHENTHHFRNYVYCATGRQPEDSDLYAHCTGLLRAAVQTATAGATP